MNPVSSQSHPATVGHQPEASLARCVGNCTSRSVDSERVSRVTEPRETKRLWEPSEFREARQQESSQWPDVTLPTGVQELGARALGFTRNLGAPCVSTTTNRPAGNRSTKPWLMHVALDAHESKLDERNVVAPSEGNEVKREAHMGVGALRSTDEAGEPTRGTPWREGGAGSRDRESERWPRYRARQLSQRSSRG